MPTFAEEHFDLLQLASILEPKEQYGFDSTIASIDQEIAEFEKWDTSIDGPKPTELNDDTPWFWYTQYWATCTLLRQCVNLNGYKFREIGDYTFYDDETIYTGHPLDLY